MKKACLGLLILLLAAAAIVCQAVPTYAQVKPDNSGKVFMAVVNTLSIIDINKKDTPNLWALAQKGASGLVSNRTLSGQNSSNSSLTIGAGNLARVYANDIMGYNNDELVVNHNQLADQIYKNLTGWDPGKSTCLLVNLPEIVTGMSQEKVDTLPGAMGENLRRNHRTVCVLGNGDINTILSRPSVTIGMDSKGRVPLGDVGPNTYHISPSDYLGWETNYNYLTSVIQRDRSQSDVIIIELSDLYRLDESDISFPTIAQQQRIIYLKRLDKFIGQLSQGMDPQKDLLMVVAPSPSLQQIKNKNTFTPLIIYGKNITHGYLTSGTTRRDYVVANTDIASTVLNFFNIKDSTKSMIGQPITSKPTNVDTLDAATKISLSGAIVNRIRSPLVTGYVVLLIIVILLSVIAIFWFPWLIRKVEPLVVSLVAVPLVFLPLGKLNFTQDWVYIVFTLAAIICLTALFIYLCKVNFFKTFTVITFITALVIDIDLITGSTMMQHSVLGFDAMLGARFYGIGNEYMGILLGCVIILATVLYEKFPRKWMLGLLGLVFLIHCYFIGAPSLGAQSDGVLTAPLAFLVTLALLGNIKIRPRVIAGILAVIMVAVLGLSFYDMSRPIQLQSHIGRAANLIKSGGFKEALTIISRKLGMNVKLIHYTSWSWVLIVALGVLALLIYRPMHAMAKIKEQHPQIIKGFAGILSGAIVGLIINDSGIIVAATICVYMIVPLLLLMMDLQKKAG
jgi:hypothetical protein